jgi:hypothetical protein
MSDTTKVVAADDVIPALTGRSHQTQVQMNRIGLEIPAELKYEDWVKTGRQLSGIVDSSAWWLGDWLVFGKANYADRYQLAIAHAGLRYQTLRNYAWVSRRFTAERRRAKLSFRHHAEVASLVVEEQERFLDLAEREQWTIKNLRSAIRRSRGALPGRPDAELNARLAFPTGRVRMWREAAEHAGIDFEEWILTELDRAASEILVPE